MEMRIIYAIAAFLGLMLIWLVADLSRFAFARRKADNPAGLKTDAGGVVFIQGGKTYYQMPKGTRRKIADYAMDLTPGSADMKMFTATMDQARKLHEAQKRAERKEAVEAMREVAREEAKRYDADPIPPSDADPGL